MKNNVTIPIVFAADENYAMPLSVTMISMLKNAIETTYYDIFILVPEKFSNEIKNKILDIENSYNCKIQFIEINNIFNDRLITIPHISHVMYYRLLITKILPEIYTKCIYLDVDIIVKEDLQTLFSIDTENYAIAGVKSAGYQYPIESAKSHSKYIGIKSADQYINSGVLLMNLSYIKNNGIDENWLKISAENNSFYDQDVINKACYNQIKQLDYRYNVTTYRWGYINGKYEPDESTNYVFEQEELKKAIENPAILHYANKIKPWQDNSVIFYEEWEKYYKYSTFYGTKIAIPKKARNTVRLQKYLNRLGNDERLFEKSINWWYKNIKDEEVDFQNTRTFQEKIQWLKMYDATSKKTQLSDLFQVRNYVIEKDGEKYLKDLIGAWDYFENVDFNSFPESFTLQYNHGVDFEVNINDKSKIDVTELESKFKNWYETIFAFNRFELQYLNIKPLITAYKRDSENSAIYEFMCFNGQVEFIIVTFHNTKTCYTNEFLKAEFQLKDNGIKEIDKPKEFDNMLKLSQSLSEDFMLVSVVFEEDRNIYFKRLEFTPYGGDLWFNDEKYDIYFGELIKLPNKSSLPRYII